MPSLATRSFSSEGLVTTVTTNPKSLATMRPNETTDHMLEMDWTAEEGWTVPVLRPYANLSMDPATQVLHYCITCFEGMKAYRSEDGKTVTLFRPLDNMRRLNDSAARLCLPQIDEEEALKLLEKFLELDARFIEPGGFMYIRPFMMGTEPNAGYKLVTQAKFMILAMKMSVLYTKRLTLRCNDTESSVRAWNGGFGNAKLGANYGPSLLEHKRAQDLGFDHVLWLTGSNNLVTEAGVMNFFAVWKTAEGVTEIITCPLTSKVVLPGITRKSVLEILRAKYQNDSTVEVVEREFTISDLEVAHAEGRLTECFTCGTAMFVSPVSAIMPPSGNKMVLPEATDDIMGPVSGWVKSELHDIMWDGPRKSHPWRHVVAGANAYA